MTDHASLIAALKLKLEPAVMDVENRVLLEHEKIAGLSSAVSLKRIADALETLAAPGKGGWALQDIAGLIAERSLP